MTLLSEPAPTWLPRQPEPAERRPRHRASEAEDPTRVATDVERRRPGRHAAEMEDGFGGATEDEDPLAWLGFRFEVG